MLKSEKNKTTIKNNVTRCIGTIFLITALVLELCSSYIGGAFQDFCDAALPWITIGVAVAVVLSVSSGREGGICEKQDPGIEKKS